MRNVVTMKDIADELDVTVMSVSKALSGKDGVSEDLRAKILAKADELGYKKAPASSDDQVSHNIGILIAERSMNANVSYMSLQQPLISNLIQLNYYGITEIISDETEHLLILPKILKENKVGGFIVLGQMSREYINLLKETNIPHLFMAHLYDNETSGIINDNLYAGYTLTNYLLDQGCKSVGFVGNIKFAEIVMDRFLGFTKALLHRGLELNMDYIIPDVNDYGEEQSLFLPDKMPESFICNDCRVAYKLIHYLEGLEYKIPKDISVAAFDDGIFADIGIPKLTTYSVNYETMAQLGAESIVLKLENPSYHIGKKVVHGSVIVRDSVKKA
ncbi:MAG: LacI family DNA-binding transcriptional regulator [Treponema sp.]|nr:LacI family DNA-binding transcriptional regulator [Treponema sp.]